MRTVVRTLIAAFLIAAPLLAALAAPAGAQTGNPVSRTDQAASHSLTVSIDSVSPTWATPGKPITVRGTVTNNTGSPVSGLQVAMQTSPSRFGTRSEMESYVADGAVSSIFLATAQVGNPYTVPGTLNPGATLNWSVSFPESETGYTQFGVYPLAAVVYDAATATPLVTDRTLLPYWPGGTPAKPMQVSWIWPLIDQPQQGPCLQTLAGNTLAASLGPSGRLGGLLSTGMKWTGQADLTWAVDPALLSDAKTMTAPYKTGGNAGCTGTTVKPASTAARKWLNTLKTDVAGQPMFVTPYADADTTALAHSGMLATMRTAYTLGEQVAGKILQRPSLGKSGTGEDGAPSAAWLGGGPTDEGVLSALAENGRVNTVVLGSADGAPALTSTVNETPIRGGGTMRVLLADSQLTSVLGSSGASSSAGAQFATEQDFLAETAQMVADEPFPQGTVSVVVAPPRQWAPSAGEANSLLSDSVHAPWLRPATLSKVASSSADPEQLPRYQFNGSQLSSSYMNLVKRVSSSLGTYQDLLYRPGPAVTQSLRAALASTTSSAWRGSAGGAGTARLIGLAGFVRDSERNVQIIAGNKFLLAGASGDIAVSVRNGMSLPVQVRVQATLPNAAQLSVGKFDGLVTVSPGKVRTVKIPVQATGIETTTLQLELVTRNGSPLSWTQQPLTVQVTRYGRALIILIGAALGVVVLASGVRWIRQWRSGTIAGSGGTG